MFGKKKSAGARCCSHVWQHRKQGVHQVFSILDGSLKPCERKVRRASKIANSHQGMVRSLRYKKTRSNKTHLRFHFYILELSKICEARKDSTRGATSEGAA